MKLFRSLSLLTLLVLSTVLGFAGGLPVAFENQEALTYVHEMLPKTGTLVLKDGYIYLKIDDRYIHDLFPMMKQEKLEKPPYFENATSPGAHISVIYESERMYLPPQLTEIGQTFEFEIVEFRSIFVMDHNEVYVVVVKSPALEMLRVKYGLQGLLNGHDFHITFAKRDYPEDQVIMKDLRFWCNDQWFKCWGPNPGWSAGDKPYKVCKGFPDDCKHLTRKDFKIWCNTFWPGFFPVVEGFDDDNVPLTLKYLNGWAKTFQQTHPYPLGYYLRQ